MPGWRASIMPAARTTAKRPMSTDGSTTGRSGASGNSCWTAARIELCTRGRGSDASAPRSAARRGGYRPRAHPPPADEGSGADSLHQRVRLAAADGVQQPGSPRGQAPFQRPTWAGPGRRPEPPITPDATPSPLVPAPLAGPDSPPRRRPQPRLDRPGAARAACALDARRQGQGPRRWPNRWSGRASPARWRPASRPSWSGSSGRGGRRARSRSGPVTATRPARGSRSTAIPSRGRTSGPASTGARRPPAPSGSGSGAQEVEVRVTEGDLSGLKMHAIHSDTPKEPSGPTTTTGRRRHHQAHHRHAGGVGRRRVLPAHQPRLQRQPRVRRPGQVRDRPPHRHREHLHRGRGAGRGAGASTTSTPTPTPGATSATTSSSTGSAPPTRAGSAACRRR